jgi:hypothetical protein
MNRRRDQVSDLRHRMRGVDREAVHRWWRRAFAAALIFALVLGLYLSFRPADFEDPPPDLASDDATQAPSDAEEQPAEPAPPAPDDEGEDESEIEEEEEDPGLTEEEAQELIDAARDPSETTVQVLDAGGGSTAASDVADVLADLGYDVVAINPSRIDYDVTTVLFTADNDAEAEGLHARDERFAATAPNERLSEGVDLHVVVGPDWGG